MNLILIIIPILAGLILSMQQTFNGALGQKIGALESSFMSFFTGSIFLSIAVIFFGNGNILAIFNVPFYYLIAALFGIIFLSLMPFTIPRIGVTNSLVMVIIGQLVSGLIIDHFGLFGSEIVKINIHKMIGIILLICSIFFIFFGEKVAILFVKKRHNK